MLTEIEAKSRALDDLASFFTAQQIPTTAAELRNAHIDIEELWSKTADPFLRAAAGQANVHGEHIVEVLKAGMLKRLLRILFDFYPLAERFDYPPRRGVRMSQSPAVGPNLVPTCILDADPRCLYSSRHGSIRYIYWGVWAVWS